MSKRGKAKNVGFGTGIKLCYLLYYVVDWLTVG